MTNLNFELNFKGDDYQVSADIDFVEENEYDVTFEAVNTYTDKILTERDSFQLTRAIQNEIKKIKRDREESCAYDDYILS